MKTFKKIFLTLLLLSVTSKMLLRHISWKKKHYFALLRKIVRLTKIAIFFGF